MLFIEQADQLVGPTYTTYNLQADPRAVSDSHRVEWRPWKENALWQEADLQLAQMTGIQNTCEGRALCTWQFPAVPLPNLPDAVEFRVRKMDLDSVGAVASSRTWLSQISGPYATAFAPPEKPRASILCDGDVKVLLAFALSEFESLERPNSLKPGHGHGLATRIQVSYRQAGDSYVDDVRELPPYSLADAETVSLRDGLGIAKIRVSQPHFREGQRILFAVRLGDDWRWSHWSSFSKPVHVSYSELFF